MRFRLVGLAHVLLLGVLVVFLGPSPAAAQTAGNPACPGEDVFFNPSNGEDIKVPDGYTVSVFAKGLNFPTGIAFLGNSKNFQVFVLESGHGLPSKCNEQTDPAFGGVFSASNPMTPDIVVFDQNGNKIAGPLGKPTALDATNTGFQAAGPAIDIAFENGFKGGRLFATDSNQATHAGGQNDSSRIVNVDPTTGLVTPLITGLPTGDHPSEQLAFRDGWMYWSQGSTTNSGVVGLDNGGGTNEPDIPCQDITLSDNLFPSGPCTGTPPSVDCSGGVLTSGYSIHGTTNPGGVVKAFTRGDPTKVQPGVCDGAVLRARIKHGNGKNHNDPASTIEPFSWGYRNPYGIRFAPNDHPLQGGLFVTENGEDERGARPTNNAPDRLALAKQNPDGSPDYHGWPDRFGFLDSTQAVFNPVGGPGDDLCTPPNPTFPACIPLVEAVDVPVKPVLAGPPQPITAPIALEPADVAVVGTDFVPDSFAQGIVQKGAALVSREGDFGFSKSNGTPEAGHDVEVVNFSKQGQPLQLNQQRFAFNTTSDQAFPDNLRGINRPTNLRFGPDNCAYLVDYGAVRDFGQSDPATRFCPANLLNGSPNPAFPGCLSDGSAPLVQIPGTGVIWKFCSTQQTHGGHND